MGPPAPELLGGEGYGKAVDMWSLVRRPGDLPIVGAHDRNVKSLTWPGLGQALASLCYISQRA